MPLRNRVAVVTGGSRGIGRGIALKLAHEGVRIAIAYRVNKAAAQMTLVQLQAAGADCERAGHGRLHEVSAAEIHVRSRLRKRPSRSGRGGTARQWFTI